MSETIELETAPAGDGGPPSSQALLDADDDPMAEAWADYRLNLQHAAHFLGVTETSLKRWLVADPSLPVLRRGGNGRPYVFWAPDLASWYRRREEREQKSDAERRADVAQLQMELLGGTMTGAADELKLTGKERREALAAEQLAMQIAQARGELVEAEAMREAIEKAFLTLRNAVLALPDRIGRELDLDRDARNVVARHCRAALETMARDLVAMEGLELEAAE